MKKVFSIIIIVLLLTSFLASAFNTQLARAEPSTTIIHDDNPITQGIISEASEEPPPTEWNKTYGGTSPDEAYALVQTADGGYALAGETGFFGAGSGDFWLVKTDASGNEQWNKTYDGGSREQAWALVQTVDGGYAMVGARAGGVDAWFVKTNASGNEEWSGPYGGTGYEEAYDLVQTGDGGYAIAGYTTSSGAGSHDFWLVKTNATYNEKWSRPYGGTDNDEAYALVQTSDGEYALAGRTYSYGAGDSDFWLVKTDTSGNMEWNRTYGGTGSDWAWDLVQTSDGGYALAGWADSFGAGDRDFWLVKTDEYGNEQWNRTYGGTGDEGYDSWYSLDLVRTADGGYALAGRTNSYGAGGFDFWLVKTDASGNMQWNKTYGGTGDERATALVQTSDGGYALAGRTDSYGAGLGDFWLVKIDSYPYEGQTICIRADGSIDPPEAPVLRNGNLYTITEDIASNADGIVVEKSSAILDGSGYTLQGSGGGLGFNLTSVDGVTIVNTSIRGFECGIFARSSTNCTVVGNNITGNNGYGISLSWSANNTFYHNSFVNNSCHVDIVPSGGTGNAWDMGYPFCGNYWKDYCDTDMYSGPFQNETGSDGVGDIPYVIDENNADHYPLLNSMDTVRPHIPIYSPAVGKYPFLLTLEPISHPLGCKWELDTELRATLWDISDRTLDQMVDIFCQIPGVDIALKVWDLVGADKDGDGKISSTEMYDLLVSTVKDDLVKLLMDNARKRLYAVSLSETYQVGNNILSGLAELGALAFGAGVAIEKLASFSFLGSSETVSLSMPAIIPYARELCELPRNIMNFFGFKDTLGLWHVSGASINGEPSLKARCPVDLVVIDELGRIVNKTLSEIPGAEYVERDLDGNGDLDDLINLPNTVMNYSVRVIPEEGADPNDTCSLIVGSDWLGYPLVRNSTISEASSTAYNLTVCQRLTRPDVAVTGVTSPRTVVRNGSLLCIDATIENQGDYAEILNITVYANTTSVASQVVTIANGNSTRMAFTWNTTSFAHAYVVSANIEPVGAEIDLADNIFVCGIIRVSCIGDINGDYATDVKDYQLVKKAIPSMPGSPKWNPNADVNDDLVISAKDYQIVKTHIPSRLP